MAALIFSVLKCSVQCWVETLYKVNQAQEPNRLGSKKGFVTRAVRQLLSQNIILKKKQHKPELFPCEKKGGQRHYKIITKNEYGTT